MTLNLNTLIQLALVCLFSVSSFADSKTSEYSDEKNKMQMARELYAKADFVKAIEIYNSIPVKSEFWIEALEERAWSNLRLKKLDKALADTKTLTADVLTSQVGPEPYYLQALIYYGLCDYYEVLKTLRMFKSRYQSKTRELQDLSNEGVSKASISAVGKIAIKKDKNAILLSDAFGFEYNSLPRSFNRDKELLLNIESNNSAAIDNRFKVLARRDLEEIQTTLTKMQLLEAQVIQKVHVKMAQNSKSFLADLENEKDNKHYMSFPGSNEVWIDELNSFEVTSAQCTTDLFSSPFKAVNK